jgi:hypothetical protein
MNRDSAEQILVGYKCDCKKFDWPEVRRVDKANWKAAKKYLEWVD